MWIICKCVWKLFRENYIYFGFDEKYINNGYNLKLEFLFYFVDYKINLDYVCSYNLFYKVISILILNDIYVLIINNWIMKIYGCFGIFCILFCLFMIYLFVKSRVCLLIFN